MLTNSATSVFRRVSLRYPRWRRVTTALLAIAWLGSWAVCPPAQAELPGSVAVHQPAGHPDGDVCFHLFDHAQVPTARYAVPVAGHLRSGTSAPSAVPPPALSALRRVVWKTLQPSFSSPPPPSPRYISPLWPHAPPRMT